MIGMNTAWRELLNREKPLLLPLAHDALAARLIERAGFSAYAIGGFPLVGARHALPDIGLVGLGEMSEGMREIMAASRLFRVTRTIEKALADLKAGRLSLAGEGVDFEAFKDVVGFAPWADVEDRFGG
jgi:2-methylisocitrate lyase-like PEP mutase family enzyme